MRGIRHHFLRHVDIIRLQQNMQSKIPQECLFNALSYKLGGAMPRKGDAGVNMLGMQFSGPRRHYSVAYMMQIGAETQQQNQLPGVPIGHYSTGDSQIHTIPQQNHLTSFGDIG